MKAQMLIMSLSAFFMFLCTNHVNATAAGPCCIKITGDDPEEDADDGSSTECCSFYIEGSTSINFNEVKTNVIAPSGYIANVVLVNSYVNNGTRYLAYNFNLNHPYDNTIRLNVQVLNHGNLIEEETIVYNSDRRSRGEIVPGIEVPQIEISPNPSNGSINIDFNNTSQRNVRIFGTVYDPFGRMVYRIVNGAIFEPGAHNLKVDLTHLPTNTYRIVFSTENKTLISKNILITP